MPPKTALQLRLDRLVELVQPERRTRILDIGANPINGCPYEALLHSGHGEVWGFEPQDEAFQQLQARKRENETYLPHAIGDGRSAELHICKSSGFTSLLPPNRAAQDYLGRWHKAMTVDRKVTVTTRRLDDLEDLPQPDLLKIDVQGAEKIIFEHGRDTLSAAVAIITEVAFVPLYQGQPLFHDQAAVLQDYGFLLHKFSFLKARSLQSPLMSGLAERKYQSQVIDGDAVLIRSLLDPESYSDEQLKHLAICADSVLGSPDLALKCLSILWQRGVVSEAGARGYAALLPHQKPAMAPAS